MEGNNVFPVPTQETVTKWLMYGGVAALTVAGLITFGPFVLTALNTAFAIGQAALAFGLLAVGMVVAGLVVYNFAPLVKGGIEIAAYNMWAKMIDAYPIAHMRLWWAKVLQGITETKAAKKELTGIVGENQQDLDAINERVDTLQTAIRDSRTSAETRDAAVRELAAKVELRKPYERVVNNLSPAIEGFDQFIRIQERYAAKLENEIEVADANWRADESIRRGLKVWERVMGRNNQAKINSEAAKRRVEQQLGNSLGQLEDMRKQMGVMVQAAARNDEIAMASARKYMEDQLRTIDVPFVEVVTPVQSNKTSSLLNLN